ncbi:hypothetical protein V8C42DRAFT_330480 [Trichoderma barbatum]
MRTKNILEGKAVHLFYNVRWLNTIILWYNQIHTEKFVECPACPRNLSTKSAMVMNLEVGRCPSRICCNGITILASECRQSPTFRDDGDGSRYMFPPCGGFSHCANNILSITYCKGLKGFQAICLIRSCRLVAPGVSPSN